LQTNIKLQAIDSLSVYPTNLLITRVANSQKDQPTLGQGLHNAGQADPWFNQSITILQPTFIWTDMNLACPARFERATYALEEFVAVQKSMYFSDLQL